MGTVTAAFRFKLFATAFHVGTATAAFEIAALKFLEPETWPLEILLKKKHQFQVSFSKNFRGVNSWISWHFLFQLLPSDLFGCFKWPFQGLSDLYLGDQKVTWKNLVLILIRNCNFLLFTDLHRCFSRWTNRWATPNPRQRTRWWWSSTGPTFFRRQLFSSDLENWCDVERGVQGGTNKQL